MQGVEGLVKNGEGIKEERKGRKPLRHRQQYGEYKKERGWGRQKRVEVGLMVMEGELTWAGEHKIQHTDDVSYYRIVS